MLSHYTDEGARQGQRTRYFRDARGGGVEWCYAVDYIGAATRWYWFLMYGPSYCIANMLSDGHPLVQVPNAEPAN